MEPYYERVTWLFVSRNFKDDATDREAARTHDRFGVTSWPQLIVFDPRDDALLAEMPRTLEPFAARLKPLFDAVPRASGADRAALDDLAEARALAGRNPRGARKVAERTAARADGVGAWLAARELLRDLDGDKRSLAERLQDPDVRERALALEEIADGPENAAAKWTKSVSARLLDDAEHIVVRLRALAWAAKVDPELVVEHAESLLEVPNDAFRYTVLQAVAAHPSPSLAALLARLFAQAGGRVPSRNPNVLRTHVAKCLGASGDASAIDAVADVVRAADPLNGTTAAVVAALRDLAPRLDAKSRRRVVELLLDGLPAALAPDAADALARLTPALLGAVHAGLEAASGKDLPGPPQAWSDADRTQYRAALGRALRL